MADAAVLHDPLTAIAAQADEDTSERDVEQLDAEIDEAVYDLFEVTDDERAVVEEYLAVF